MQKTKNKTALVWFRNDLRTHDSLVLQNACQNTHRVLAVYCLDPKHFENSIYGFKKTEKFRAQFLLETLKDLKAQLGLLNIDLLVYFEKPEHIIPQLCQEHNIEAIYLQKEWTQEEVDTENTVKSSLDKTVNWNSVYNQFLYHPEDIQMDFQSIPQVFTVFRKKLEKFIKIRPEVTIEPLPESNRIENKTFIPSLNDLGLSSFEPVSKSAFPFKGGETAALKRLNNYFFETKKLGVYKKTRNGLVGTDYSSKFSAWLANGSLSPRTIYWQVAQFEKDVYKNDSTYWMVFELIWRDYFKYISLKHGNEIFQLQGILKKDYTWGNNIKFVNEWINGQTYSDFVNANMLELKKTGWMSNRGRQNVASYFAKNLKLDWRIGATYFESLLIDYDVHSNYGNWMYVAGVGNDPRDRVFNVQLQAERYDNNFAFRRLWLQSSLF